MSTDPAADLTEATGRLGDGERHLLEIISAGFVAAALPPGRQRRARSLLHRRAWTALWGLLTGDGGPESVVEAFAALDAGQRASIGRHALTECQWAIVPADRPEPASLSWWRAVAAIAAGIHEDDPEVA